ncbi:hypothetical protein H0H92_000105 [Tricholoma furcatifolium]|nr:hypothetical protein H0H92_000105 [Tricholoma furcatifolium]
MPRPSNPPKQEQPPAPASTRHVSDRTFVSVPLSQASQNAIKHQFMSDVQAATIDHALAGKDLLVQAKTGTGKTLAFLLPTIERLAKAPKPLKGVSALVIAPTRELALQILDEANMLLERHKNITAAAIMGGTKPHQSLNLLLKKPPTILIATPGRLRDHLTDVDQSNNVQANFRGLQALIYDEADSLLDHGFKKDLDDILSALPSRKVSPRQVMLFSATLSNDIKQIARAALDDKHVFVSTLLKDEVNAHEHVPQTQVTTPFSNTLPALLRILRLDRTLHADAGVSASALSAAAKGQRNPISKSKVMVFFPTARHVCVAHELFSALPGLPPVWEVHSRLSQSKRLKSTNDFGEAIEGILLSSDVAARGMDFAGVTHVVQVGLPSSSEQYIHRLGRTARAGNAGRGTIVLNPDEAGFLGTKEMRTMKIQADGQFTSNPDAFLAERQEVEQALAKNVEAETKAQAYRAWMGYYKSHLKLLKWDREKLVMEANAYVREALGWKEEKVPTVETKLVGKMGMKGVKGLNVVPTQVKRRAVGQDNV